MYTFPWTDSGVCSGKELIIKDVKDNKENHYYLLIMRTIYLLELEKKHYFLFTRDSHYLSTHDLVHLFLELNISYEYIQQYKPVVLLEKWQETHSLDIDTLVKKQMLIYGIDNVRGGSYSNSILTPEQIKLLEIELQGSPNTCSPELVKEIFDKYTCRNPPLSKSEIKTEYEKISKDFTKYKKEYSDLNVLQSLNISIVNENIDWLENVCDIQANLFKTGQTNTSLYKLQRPEIVAKYNEVMKSIKSVYKYFINCYIGESTDTFVKYPEFVFDDFIYHGHRLNKSIDDVRYVCGRYRFFLTYLENRLNERIFDVESWGKNAENRFFSTLSMLKILESL